MQNILNLKLRLEDQQKLAFGQALTVLGQEQQREYQLLEQESGYVAELKENMEASGKEILDLMEIQRLQDGVATLKYYITEQKKVVKRCERRLEEERFLLAEAMKERKIQEKLREQAFDKFREEEEASERREIDELVSYQFGFAAEEEAQREGSERNGKEKEETGE